MTSLFKGLHRLMSREMGSCKKGRAAPAYPCVGSVCSGVPVNGRLFFFSFSARSSDGSHSLMARAPQASPAAFFIFTLVPLRTRAFEAAA